MKKKLIISLIAIFLILGVVFAIGAFAKENEDSLISKSKTTGLLLFYCYFDEKL